MKVVLDTNTLISALVFRRENWSWLREAWKSGQATPLVSSATAKELMRVLAYPKFRLSPGEQKTLLEDILPYSETVPQLGEAVLEPCRDPNDQVFLETAVAGNAEYLVTGDADLLQYLGAVPFGILTPEEFRRFLETR
ncbi:MAG: putative toxin-antitoxin system toxin component, PIN family [Spirochaetales bacterium]